MPVLNGYMEKTQTCQAVHKQLRVALIAVEPNSSVILVCKTKPVS